MNSKKLLALTLGLCLVSSVAMAVNPAEWDFVDEQVDHGGELHWVSSTAVDTNFNHYDFTYEITSIKANVLNGWMEVSGFIDDPSLLMGSGGRDGTLPLDMGTNAISQQGTETVGTPPLAMDINYDIQLNLSMSVDENGFGHVDVTDVVLLINGAPSAMQISGNMEVTGSNVPEPGTMALLGVAGAALVARRRKNRK